jgi:hypothetical protein
MAWTGTTAYGPARRCSRDDALTFTQTVDKALCFVLHLRICKIALSDTKRGVFMSDSTESPQVASIPGPIIEQPEAINLYRIAIYALAAIALIVVVGVMALSFFGRVVPESVIVLGSVAVGALAGMVAGEQRA